MNLTGDQKHGIYIHTPFCLKKCVYCDFYSLTDLTLRQPFVDALLGEMTLAGQLEVPSDTLYFGGGTPSVLTPRQIETLLEQVQQCFALAPDTEITMEVNPGTITQDHLHILRQMGINRLNIGVQSFSADMLAFLGRIHTSKDAIKTIEQARRAGFDNLGLDLMFGIPGQDVSAWHKDLTTALDGSPEHLSCYILTIEEGTILGQMRKAKAFEVLPEQDIARLFQITQQVLSAAGYDQYEISNYAKPAAGGRSLRSRHNQKYWTFAPYTGLGPSAHSYAPPARYWNVRDVGHYLDTLTRGKRPIQAREETTQEQQITETLYLGLRTADGIDTVQFEKRFKLDFMKQYGDTLKAIGQENWVMHKNGRCALTPKGMLFHDSIVERLLMSRGE
jgi:putative oxygen-independent coproporphyrinogen III oxidase